jgi:ABC-type antimicrobial peptide transport system permease subunit
MSVLLLSAAGIYALTAFTVGQRRREIGIRTALGAPPRRLLLSVFGRVIVQLAAGIATGSLLAAALASAAGFPVPTITVLLVAVAGVMALVAIVAASGPARRSLAINTAEVLRTDG